MKRLQRILLVNSYVHSVNVKSSMVGPTGEEPYPPVGLLYLASSLRIGGWEVRILDLPVVLKKTRKDTGRRSVNSLSEVEEVVKYYLLDFKPTVVGISCLFSGKFRGAIFISQIVKRVDPKCIVVFGGLHPTVFASATLERLPSIDYVILGEGEESFVNLLTVLEGTGNIQSLDGIAYREGTKVVVIPKTQFIKRLDHLPMPAWDMIDLEDYAIEKNAWDEFWENPRGYRLHHRVPILTSRSCPMQCRFCAMHLVHGPRIRFRSVDNCLEEIKMLYNDHGVNYFSIIDDNFTLKKERILRLADAIVKERVQIYLDSPSGVSMRCFDKDILEALKAMGMTRLFFAIESGSDYMREQIMGKRLSRQKIYECSDLVKNERDILVRAFFVIGMPQETEETLEASYEMMQEIHIDDASIHIAVPFPGTPLYEEVRANNLFLIPEHDAFVSDEYQQSSDRVFIRPYNLRPERLLEFKKDAENIFRERREKYGIKINRSIKHLYDF